MILVAILIWPDSNPFIESRLFNWDPYFMFFFLNNPHFTVCSIISKKNPKQLWAFFHCSIQESLHPGDCNRKLSGSPLTNQDSMECHKVFFFSSGFVSPGSRTISPPKTSLHALTAPNLSAGGLGQKKTVIFSREKGQPKKKTQRTTAMSMLLSKWILTPVKVGCKSRK